MYYDPRAVSAREHTRNRREFLPATKLLILSLAAAAPTAYCTRGTISSAPQDVSPTQRVDIAAVTSTRNESRNAGGRGPPPPPPGQKDKLPEHNARRAPHPPLPPGLRHKGPEQKTAPKTAASQEQKPEPPRPKLDRAGPTAPAINRTIIPVAVFGAPKTAGRSFRADTASLYTGIATPRARPWTAVRTETRSPPQSEQLRCSASLRRMFRTVWKSNSELASMAWGVRNLISTQVQALYYHCATAEREFQGGRSAHELGTNFSAWVAAWADAVARALDANAKGEACPRDVTYRFMPCYVPVDTMSYSLECKSPRSLEYQSRLSWPREDENRHAPRGRKKPQLKHPPNLCKWLAGRDLAASSLRLTKQSFVGVTELYDESLCVLQYYETGALPRTCRCEHFRERESTHLRKKTAPHSLADVAPATLALIKTYLVAYDAPLYNLARDRLLAEIRAVEKATGARMMTCGVDGDDDDDDKVQATHAGFGVGHSSFKAAFPDSASWAGSGRESGGH